MLFIAVLASFTRCFGVALAFVLFWFCFDAALALFRRPLRAVFAQLRCFGVVLTLFRRRLCSVLASLWRSALFRCCFGVVLTSFTRCFGVVLTLF